MLSVELHCHSEHSHDGVDSVRSMLERASEAGLDAIAVTDHDSLAGSHEAMELAPEYDLVALSGTEVTSRAGHVLAIGVAESIPPREPFAETVRLIHEAGGVAIAAHPYGRIRRGVLGRVAPDDLDIVDAIETYNSRFLVGRPNRQAARLADRLGLPATAGSDAHVAEMVGRATTFVDAVPDAEAIVEAIADGRTEIERRRTPLGAWVRQFARSGYQRTQQRLGR